MFTGIRRSGAAAALALAVGAGAAHAELLEIAYTSAAGEPVAAGPEAARYANPSGAVAFALSAGLERKVRIELRDAQGGLRSAATSGVLGADDRITVGGQTYYGARLTLPAPADGAYELRAAILDNQGAPVAEDRFPWTVDTQAPDVSHACFAYSAWRSVSPCAPDSDWLIGGYEISTGLTVAGAADTGSGLAPEAVARVFPQTGADPVHERAVQVGPDGAGTLCRQDCTALFPAPETYYRVEMTWRDRAGNAAQRIQNLGWDGRAGPAPEPVAVYDPNYDGGFLLGGWTLQGFRAFEGVVYTNPVKLLFRLPKAEWIGNNPFGQAFSYKIDPATPEYQDADYVYKIVTGAHGNWATYRGTGSTTEWYANWLTYSATLAPGVEDSPGFLEMAFRWSDIGWSTAERHLSAATGPQTIEAIRFTVEPRGYQQIAGGWNGIPTCAIAPGKTQCTVYPELVKGTGDYGRWDSTWVRVRDPAGLLESDAARVGPRSVRWDRVAPAVVSAEVDAAARRVTVQTWENDAFWPERIRSLPLSGILIGRDPDTGTVLRQTAPAAPAALSAQDYRWVLDYGDWPDGRYELVARVSDQERYGNTGEMSVGVVTIDRSPPEIGFRVGDEPFTGGDLGALDDLAIEVGDAADPAPRITAVTLGGGPSGADRSLAWSPLAEGRWRLEYPVLFPSGGAPYRLTVSAQDAQGNTTTAEVAFDYRPPQVDIAAASEGLWIPAVAHVFRGPDGANPFITEPVAIDGVPIAGTYDLQVSLDAGASVALQIAGERVAPGETLTLPAYDFGANGGRISLPVAAADAGAAGDARLLVYATAPGAPVAIADVHVWTAAAELAATSWSPAQLLEPLAVTASAGAGTRCRLTASAAEARETAADAPVCLLEWTALPAEAAADGLGVGGRIAAAGPQWLGYRLSLYDGDQPVVLAEGGREVDVQPAYGLVQGAIRDKPAPLYRAVRQADLRVVAQGDEDCRFTRDQAVAAAAARAGGLGCLFEWTRVPAGFAQAEWSDAPRLGGATDSREAIALGWRISAVTRAGQQIPLNEQTEMIEVADPPQPDLAIEERLAFAPGRVAAPLAGAFVGTASASAINAGLDLTVYHNEVLADHAHAEAGFGDALRLSRRLTLGQLPLWTQTRIRVAASYTDLPEVYSEREIEVLAVPADDVRPELLAGVTAALDTEPLPVTVRMADAGGFYDAATMGAWEVRVMRVDGREAVPLTEYAPVDAAGVAGFEVALDGLGGGNQRLTAEARLISPVADYQRVVPAPRPVVIALLRGAPIGAEVSARRVTGAAPLTLVANLQLADSRDQSALGEIHWQVRRAGGDWLDEPSQEILPTRFATVFGPGRHEVRALVENRHSGIRQVTAALDIHVYERPDLALRAPRNAFVGADARIVAEAAGPGAIEYQWSFDRGESWSPGDGEAVVSLPEPGQSYVWVRGRYADAPTDDEDAWTLVRSRVSFVPVKPPSVRITGPSRVEVGETARYEAVVQPPYPDMEVALGGEWTLPDGTVASGASLDYVPTDDDLTAERVVLGFTGWIVGYRDAGAERHAEHRLQTWRYQWPEFRLEVSSDVPFAPANITARLGLDGGTQLRDLDEPVITWSIPAGLTAAPGGGAEDMRALQALAPGEYPLSVTVADRRGNRATAARSVTVEPMPPYAIDLAWSADNPYERAPMAITVRPYISGGHPRDRIDGYRYFLDEEPASDDWRISPYGKLFVIDPGSHDVRLAVNSRMGVLADARIAVNAAANQPPTCELAEPRTGSTLRFTARCTDPDGRLSRYRWTVNGAEQGIAGYSISLSSAQMADGQPAVSVVGIDDAGAESNVAAWP